MCPHRLTSNLFRGYAYRSLLLLQLNDHGFGLKSKVIERLRSVTWFLLSFLLNDHNLFG